MLLSLTLLPAMMMGTASYFEINRNSDFVVYVYDPNRAADEDAGWQSMDVSASSCSSDWAR